MGAAFTADFAAAALVSLLLGVVGDFDAVERFLAREVVDVLALDVVFFAVVDLAMIRASLCLFC